MLAICLKKKTKFHGSYEEQNQVIKMKLLHIITIIVKFYDYGEDMDCEDDDVIGKKLTIKNGTNRVSNITKLQ